MMGRTAWYTASEEDQQDLDVFIAFCNEQRRLQGRRLKGRTPAQPLRDALDIERLPAFAPPGDRTNQRRKPCPRRATEPLGPVP
jgi:hypothetical protein